MKNQKATEKKVMTNLNKFPHLKNVKEGIELLKRYSDHLQLRKKMLTDGDVSALEISVSTSPSYLKNEKEIILLETEFKIMKNNRNIAERSEYYDNYFKDLVNLYDEVESNYDDMRKKAILLSRDKNFHNSKALKKDLDEANDYASKFQNNWELKFRHYVEMKKLTAPKKEENTLEVVK